MQGSEIITWLPESWMRRRLISGHSEWIQVGGPHGRGCPCHHVCDVFDKSQTTIVQVNRIRAVRSGLRPQCHLYLHSTNPCVLVTKDLKYQRPACVLKEYPSLCPVPR